MPLDILVLFWGDPDMLRQTVRSVLAQTSDQWVLTVVDDAYPGDDIREFFAEIDDARVTYLRHEHNLGITENYRACVARATGCCRDHGVRRRDAPELRGRGARRPPGLSRC